MYIDRIDLTLPVGDITALLTSFTSAKAQLEFLPTVSPSDRKHYAKLGLKNEALARQIIEVGRQNPDLIPRGIDFEKIDRDIVARTQLQALKLVLEALLGRINDSLLLTGVDIYAAALSIYHCLRRNADTTSLKETVDELKKGFARPSRKKRQVETAPVPVAAPATGSSAVPPVAPAAPGSAPMTMEPVVDHVTPVEVARLVSRPSWSSDIRMRRFEKLHTDEGLASAHEPGGFPAISAGLSGAIPRENGTTLCILEGCQP